MLIKCNECGHQVSDKADTCPNCNTKVTKVLNGFEYFFKIILGAYFVCWLIGVAFLEYFGIQGATFDYILINNTKIGSIEIGVFLSLILSVFLSFREHKKYKSFKAKYGN